MSGYDPVIFEDLPVCALWDGWESIANYMIVKGETPVGRRVKRRLPRTSRAPAAIAELEENASEWGAFRKRKPIVQMQKPSDVAHRVYPFNDEYGFSTQLVGLADEICGPGGWKAGVCSAAPVDVLVKVLYGKPRAMIAPARRSDWAL